MIHDENKDVRLLSKIAKIDPSSKTIRIKKNQIIGNRRWGRLDFLVHHRGYYLVFEDGVVIPTITETTDKKKQKREQKELKKKSNKKVYG